MPQRVLLPLTVLLGTAAFGTVLWATTHTQPEAHASVAAPAVPPPEPTVDVLVAAHALPIGRTVGAADVQGRALPAKAVLPDVLRDTREVRRGLFGAMLRTPVPAGGLLLGAALLHPGDSGYLAAMLPPGTRAVTIGVDAVSGVAGLVAPGDVVDLLLTRNLTDPTSPALSRTTSETVLTGLRVVATDRDLFRGDRPEGPPPALRLITFQATQEQAERILIASQLGRLALSVCPPGEHPNAQLPRPLTAADLASGALPPSAGPAAPGADTLHVFEGNSDPKDYHF